MLESLTPPEPKKAECKIIWIREEFSETDKKIFDDAIADTESWTATSLSTQLRKLGVVINEKSIRAHRRGDCACSNA